MPGSSGSTLGAWGQGTVLSHAHTVALGLLDPNDVSHVAIVITHDCDMVQPARVEPLVEIVIASLDVSENHGLRHGKSARSLQMEWSYRGENRLVELSATRKHLLDKQLFEGQLPNPDYKLPTGRDGVSLLRQWLAVRYFRSAFPDEFNARLRRSKVEEGLLKVLKKCPYITAVYIQLNTQEELASDDPTPYVVDLVLAYDEGAEPDAAANAVEDVASEIVGVFEKRCMKASEETWEHLQLRRCTPIAESDLKVADAKRLSRLNLDYISLREDPPGPTGFGVQD